jgi:ubiquinone/menaquinone biosynthesis C-methylase UbiE
MERMSTTQDSNNRQVMVSRNIVAGYSRWNELSEAEAAGLARIAPEAKGRPILDIGVGGGRTVNALRAVSDDYLGVDYSPAMIDSCRRLYPGVRFEHADARDLSRWPDGSFFLAMFSCNGLGMVNHADRLAILREVRRVLVPGGAFLFSTHNKASSDATMGFQFPPLDPAWNPARMGVRMARFVKRIAVRVLNRRRLQGLTEHGNGYSIINDVCHDYSTMLYYVDLAEQRRQLREAGFVDSFEAWNLDGKQTDERSTDGSVMLLVRTPK